MAKAAASNPAEECRKKAGVWDKATKTCKPPSSTVPR